MFCDIERLGLTHHVARELERMEDWDATILNRLIQIRLDIRAMNEALYWHDSSFHDVDELYELAPAIDAAIAGYVERRLYAWTREIDEPAEDEDNGISRP